MINKLKIFSFSFIFHLGRMTTNDSQFYFKNIGNIGKTMESGGQSVLREAVALLSVNQRLFVYFR